VRIELYAKPAQAAVLERLHGPGTPACHPSHLLYGQIFHEAKVDNFSLLSRE